MKLVGSDLMVIWRVASLNETQNVGTLTEREAAAFESFFQTLEQRRPSRPLCVC